MQIISRRPGQHFLRALAPVLFVTSLLLIGFGRSNAGQNGWASTAQANTTSAASSGIEGRTIAIVGSGAEGGTTSKRVVSIEFAIVPMDDGSAKFDAAIFVTSEQDGSFRVALPSGQYRIVSMDEARNPDEFKHMRQQPPMMLRKQTVRVRSGTYTEVDVLLVGQAP